MSHCTCNTIAASSRTLFTRIFCTPSKVRCRTRCCLIIEVHQQNTKHTIRNLIQDKNFLLPFFVFLIGKTKPVKATNCVAQPNQTADWTPRSSLYRMNVPMLSQALRDSRGNIPTQISSRFNTRTYTHANLQS